MINWTWSKDVLVITWSKFYGSSDQDMIQDGAVNGCFGWGLFSTFNVLFVCPILCNFFLISFTRNELLDIRHNTPNNLLLTFEHSDLLLDTVVGEATILYKLADLITDKLYPDSLISILSDYNKVSLTCELPKYRHTHCKK